MAERISEATKQWRDRIARHPGRYEIFTSGFEADPLFGESWNSAAATAFMRLKANRRMIQARPGRLGSSVADSQAHSFFIIGTTGGDQLR